eukprot:CAMPEP_0181298672 /NCGR_PEP_ID=MMETSP1101-20121128/5912_1 /TAXON_ID=46948 /ORGANISM="Rhodomonas abbreviata, Strain Caron Lab Isolate" /LENGTH=71 /DNA_ID=CAMNT_0023403719 /DNA_START=122 /DNA_END=334 /DNA_ORIENTATION=-
MPFEFHRGVAWEVEYSKEKLAELKRHAAVLVVTPHCKHVILRPGGQYDASHVVVQMVGAPHQCQQHLLPHT